MGGEGSPWVPPHILAWAPSLWRRIRYNLQLTHTTSYAFCSPYHGGGWGLPSTIVFSRGLLLPVAVVQNTPVGQRVKGIMTWDLHRLIWWGMDGQLCPIVPPQMLLECFSICLNVFYLPECFSTCLNIFNLPECFSNCLNIFYLPEHFYLSECFLLVCMFSPCLNVFLLVWMLFTCLDVFLLSESFYTCMDVFILVWLWFYQPKCSFYGLNAVLLYISGWLLLFTFCSHIDYWLIFSRELCVASSRPPLFEC